MQMIRQTALGVCLLCAIAGMIRIFWPDNHFKPVINTVLLLYILTSVLQTGRETDWNAVAKGIGGFSPQTPSSADLTAYEEQLGLDVSVMALETLLEEKGITANLSIQDGTLHVTLAQESDRSAAQSLLEENSGTLPFVLETEGGARDD